MIWSKEEMKDILRDLEEFNCQEGRIAMEALLDVMLKELKERRN